MNYTTLIALYRKNVSQVIIYVSYDLEKWIEWKEVNVNENSILAFVVSHADGQFIDGENVFEPLPEKIYFIEERNNQDRSNLPKFSEIVSVSELVEIKHLPSPFQSYDSSLYTTQLSNKGPEPIKIRRFSSYNNGFWNTLKSRPLHSTIIDGWFNDLDFRMWYNQQSEWIPPQHAVCDYRNYGEQCCWVYEIQTFQGTIFWIKSTVEKS